MDFVPVELVHEHVSRYHSSEMLPFRHRLVKGYALGAEATERSAGWVVTHSFFLILDLVARSFFKKDLGNHVEIHFGLVFSDRALGSLRTKFNLNCFHKEPPKTLDTLPARSLTVKRSESRIPRGVSKAARRDT